LGEVPGIAFTDSNLARVAEKRRAGRRLDLQDAVDCLTTLDLFGLGQLAHQDKLQRYGRRVTYVFNRQVNPTNICVLTCAFCDFAARPNAPDGYEMSMDAILSACEGGMREVHIVGGLHPHWKYEYYLDMIRAIHSRFPALQIKAWTAVEMDFFAKLAKKDVTEVLADFKDVGLDAMPGGGAEVLSARVRKALFPTKIGAERWLQIHELAHGMGIKSNATLLYGHIETAEEVGLHMLALRDLQDRTAGFLSFIPLALQPGDTGLADRPTPAGLDLRIVATARLVLDNIPHIKAYWVMLGVPTATVALNFGADDVDGTIGKETIAHRAGAESPVELLRGQLEDMIKDAGQIPVERDALYNHVELEVA
jgi:aminodeoxyfutalosine synthase